jgi:hypothetical protein
MNEPRITLSPESGSTKRLGDFWEQFRQSMRREVQLRLPLGWLVGAGAFVLLLLLLAID